MSHRSGHNVVYCSSHKQTWQFLESSCRRVQNCPPYYCPPRNQQNRPYKDKYGYRDETPPYFTPEPNVPITPPRKDPGRGKDAEAIKELQKKVDQLNANDGRMDSKFQKRLDEIMIKIADIASREGKPGRRGDSGKDGKDGRPGRDGIDGSTGKICRAVTGHDRDWETT